MARWTRALIEVYDESGYRGGWESNARPGGGWDMKSLPSLARLVRTKLLQPTATILYCEDGDTLVLGVFDGIEPPPVPKRGTPIVPDTFEDHM